MNSFFENIHRIEDYGFKIFNSPPLFQPLVLFVGFQPGGGTADWEDERQRETHLVWPKEAEYVTKDWLLARRMRAMFQPDIDLRECVGMNAIFLRSPKVKIYKGVLANKRDYKTVKEFCLQQVRSIIDLLDPKMIVMIGLDTLRLFSDTEPALWGAKGGVLARKGMIGSREAIGVLHLSGYQMSNENRKLIAEYIKIHARKK